MVRAPAPSHETLFDFWKSIKATRKFWSSFSDLIVCPQTSHGALLMFPDAAIRIVKSSADLYEFLNNRVFEDVAILSPWLLIESEDFVDAVRNIAQRNRRSLGINISLNTGLDYIGCRKQIHAAGYYEVGSVKATGDGAFQVEDSSIAYLPNGEFSLLSDNAGISAEGFGHVTFLASRVALINKNPRVWTSVVDLPRRDATQSVRGAQGDFSFIKATIPSNEQKTKFLSAIFQWTDTSSGHASLVSCYAGPGDEHMYASLLEPLGRGIAKISLWREHMGWETLKSLVVQSGVQGETSFLNLRLVTTAQAVEVLADGVVIIRQLDQSLLRTPHLGLRFSGDTIRLSQIELGQI